MVSRHHEGNKDFALDSRKIANTSFDKILEEVKKCIVLCSNCHFEHHNPELVCSSMKEKYKVELEQIIKNI